MRAPRSLSAAEIEDAAMRAPRRRGERVDSVDSVTLADRVFHLERMSKADIDRYGVCHGAATNSRAPRGERQPAHTRGERGDAAPAPRRANRNGFI